MKAISDTTGVLAHAKTCIDPFDLATSPMSEFLRQVRVRFQPKQKSGWAYNTCMKESVYLSSVLMREDSVRNETIRSPPSSV